MLFPLPSLVLLWGHKKYVDEARNQDKGTPNISSSHYPPSPYLYHHAFTRDNFKKSRIYTIIYTKSNMT